MIYDLQIKKGGTLVFQDWDPVLMKFIEVKITTSEIPFYFNDIVCLENNFTLKDFFLFIAKHIDIFSIVVGCDFLAELVFEALLEISDQNQDIAALELKRVAILHKSQLHFYFDFYGIGINNMHGIGLSPINTLIAYPIILNEDVIIEDADTEKTYFKCKMGFSLIDFVSGIMEELSFVGPPDIRDLTYENLKGISKEFKDRKNTGWENFKKEIDKKAPKIPCKICGKDANTRCFEKPSDICTECFEHIKEN